MNETSLKLGIFLVCIGFGLLFFILSGGLELLLVSSEPPEIAVDSLGETTQEVTLISKPNTITNVYVMENTGNTSDISQGIATNECGECGLLYQGTGGIGTSVLIETTNLQEYIVVVEYNDDSSQRIPIQNFVSS